MAFMLLSPPLGVILGYLLTAYLSYTVSWRFAFCLIGVLFLIVVLLISFVPPRYLNINQANQALNFEKKVRKFEQRTSSRNAYGIDVIEEDVNSSMTTNK